ncbi:DNA primase/helicase [Staphylococcus phage Twort]|uniref:DNA primase/helicase n=2 Tax=Staphylococcus phage Twort (strain DSM 17442 / HER 48) TaxID=2908167 RepID=A0A6H0X5C8_BPTWO|nr:DNA primase/helicase [Staphylococcus phage Twort]AAX92319.1 ORF023 [Staphylococcus phage Twort]QIW89134.1 DNA primase/helicase [Staphylococcus phage Twort]
MRFQDFLTQELGTPKINNGEYQYCCPFCGEQKYKFYVKDSLQSDNGLYHCKKCDATGNPITFMKGYYSVSAKQAIDLLETKNITFEISPLDNYSNELSESDKLILHLRKKNHKQETRPTKPPRLPIGFKYLKDNLQNKESYPFLYYLKNRGITLDQIIEHNIAYVTDGYFYKTNGEKASLRNSVIFFTYDNNGKYKYWNTRSIEPNPYLKSINAPSKEQEYARKNCIFNFNVARNERVMIITEGVFDALTFGKSGVATFGKQVTQSQLDQIIQHTNKDTIIYIMLDSDALTNNIKLARRLHEHFTTFVVPHGVEDANDMGKEKAVKVLKENRILATPENLQNYLLQQKLTFNA